MKRISLLVVGLLAVLGSIAGAHQDGLVPAPDRRAGEGLGPFATFTIRNVMVIDGTGAPPYGPVDVVVASNRIARIRSAGTPGVPCAGAGAADSADHDDRRHRHVPDARLRRTARRTLGDPRKTPDAEYVYKLWLAHGVTTVRGVELDGRSRFAAKEKERSAAQRHRRAAHLQLPAPRRRLGGLVDTPEKARAWVRGARPTASTA